MNGGGQEKLDELLFKYYYNNKTLNFQKGLKFSRGQKLTFHV
jgi:hypothetical protein